MPTANPLAYLGEEIQAWRAEGTYQRLRVLETESAAEARFDGKDVINLASNNYLGLTTHPKLREAALAAVRKFGAGTETADQRRRVLDGRRHRTPTGSMRRGRAPRGHHDGRRCALVGRPRASRPRNHRSFRRARARTRAGRDALEGDRGAGWIC